MIKIRKKLIKASNLIRTVVFSITAFLLFSFVAISQLKAQVPAELGTGSITSSVNGPTPNSQYGRLLLNTSGTTYTAPNSTVNITASLSNQQYVGSQTGAGNPVIMFGATINNNGTSPISQATYAAMTAIGSPANSNYSNTASGSASGIDVATNLAFNMLTSVHQWGGKNTPATNSRVYMGDLTVTFSTPLTNPLMHIVGIGGTSGNLGFATELDLTTPGLTLSKVQGNTALAVTTTQIKNNNASGIGASCATNDAGCGTVKINGNKIQTVTFKLYLRGDGGAGDWGTVTHHPGDQWLFGFSVPETFTLSGNVYNDPNGLGDNTVNGTGTSEVEGVQLYANVIEPETEKVIGSTAVKADGTYSFNGIPKGAAVRVELSKNQGTATATAPAKSLPYGWTNSGENIGTAAGSDGMTNGAIDVTVSANVSNVNLAIFALAPTAASVTVAGRVATQAGQGIRNVTITMTDTNGTIRTAKSSSFGYYRFTDLTAGQTYIFTIKGKTYTFSQPVQVLNVNEDTYDVNFISNPK